MNCLVCRSVLENRRRAFMVELDQSIVIVKNVPSQVCPQCGEVSYSDAVMKQLEGVVAAARSTMMEIAVINFSDQVA